MSKDIDIDQSLVGGVGTNGAGQQATVVCPNRKCSGCLHYEQNRNLCLVAKQPTSCGSGKDATHGYSPIISCDDAKSVKSKKGQEHQAPTAHVGKPTQPKGPAFSVKVLNNDKSLHKAEQAAYDMLYKALVGQMSQKDPEYFKHENYADPRTAQKNHLEQKHNWSMGGRSLTANTPEGHRYMVVKQHDNTHVVHVKHASGKSGYLASNGSLVPSSADAAIHPSASSAVAAASGHYKVGGGGRMIPAGSIFGKSMTSLAFFGDDKKARAVPDIGGGMYHLDYVKKSACFVDDDGGHTKIPGSYSSMSELDDAVSSDNHERVWSLAKSSYEQLVVETAVEAADLLKSFNASPGDPSAHDTHKMYSIRDTSHGAYHVTPHPKGGVKVDYVPKGPDGLPNHKAAEPVHGSDQVGLSHEAVGAAVAAHHATTKMNNWVANRNNMAAQLQKMSGQQAPAPLKQVSPAAPNKVAAPAQKKGILPDVAWPKKVGKSISFLQNLFKSVK